VRDQEGDLGRFHSALGVARDLGREAQARPTTRI
jgi:hypothetical protein